MQLLDNTFYVIENFFELEYQNYLENIFQYTTPWYFTKSTLAKKEDGIFDNNTFDSPQFSLQLCRLDNIDKELEPISFFDTFKNNLENVLPVKVRQIIRSHATLTLPIVDGWKNKRFHAPAHVDLEVPKHLDYGLDDVITCIYYINDSDGDTLAFYPPDKTKWNRASNLEVADRVTPKKGNLILFKGSTLHAGCPPIHTKSRCLININMILE